ncbi:MAG: Plug domain-containing protein, partial [Candidatus Marinimicrobia bacterium]|nr:Plug domain-containing protein [Candidatus Neomarinimicrobiota bacterium]
AASQTGSTVITAEMIRQAGVTRLGDIFLLVPEWTMNSMDGYSWRVSPRGLSPFQIQSWLVFLDGHKMDLQFVDFNHLNLLPVVLEDIKSIEIISVPQLVEGEFAGHGAIHIHTTKPPDRVSVTGVFLLGNETGDPGPYRFTEFASANVDRSAYDGAVSLSWRAESAYLRGSLLVQHHPFTDVAVLRRNRAMVNDWPGLGRSILPSLT